MITDMCHIFGNEQSIRGLVLRFLQGIMSRQGGSIYIKDNTIDKLASARILEIWGYQKLHGIHSGWVQVKVSWL